MMSSGAFAQSAGGSNGNGDTPDDPVGSASCHSPDSYDALWVEEQLELVIDIGKREAARQGCGKSDGDRTAYPIRLSNPDFMGQYVVMRVHGACQLSGASVLWKKAPKTAGIAPNGNLACGCRVTEYTDATVAELSFARTLVSSERSRGTYAIVPDMRSRSITIVPPRLQEGECGGNKYCKIQAPEKIWVEESFSKLSLRIAQAMSKRHSSADSIPPAPVCSLSARRSSPLTEDICRDDFGSSESSTLRSTGYNYTVTVPEEISFLADIPNPAHSEQVLVELCDNAAGENQLEPDSNTIWTIALTSFDSSVGIGGTPNFPVRFVGPESQIAIGQ